MPRCLIVIAPHADDETIGAHGLMARIHARGVDVRVIVVTDGSASHPGSASWPRERLIRERQRETLRTMRQIGIAARSVTFLGLPDGALQAMPATVDRLIARSLRRAPGRSIVLAPSSTDDHPDHRAVAAAIGGTRVAGMRRLAYPVWPASDRLRGGRVLPLTAQERLAKRRALAGYRTQTGLISDDPSGFSMTPRQIAAFSGFTERFLEVRR